MDKAEQKVIDNLKEQIKQKRLEHLDRTYVYAIQETMNQKYPEVKKDLTFISGSTTVYNIDNIDRIVTKYTPYLQP